MIHIVTPENDYLYRDEMDQAYRLRHRVFVEERGWSDLAKPDGREIDQFDTKHAVHMLYIEHGEVLGYQRMLPTTRPHLLSDVMPELCMEERPVGAHIWEWTRYCVEPRARDKGLALGTVAAALGLGAVEWSLDCGIVKLIVEMGPEELLPLIQLHFHPIPLGLPRPVNGRDVIAVTLTYNGRTLERLHELRGNRRPALAEPFAPRPALLHA